MVCNERLPVAYLSIYLFYFVDVTKCLLISSEDDQCARSSLLSRPQKMQMPRAAQVQSSICDECEWMAQHQAALHCETDITLWSLLIKATMTFKAEFDFDWMRKIRPSLYGMAFRHLPFPSSALLSPMKHKRHNSRSGLDTHRRQWNGTYDLPFWNSCHWNVFIVSNYRIWIVMRPFGWSNSRRDRQLISI